MDMKRYEDQEILRTQAMRCRQLLATVVNLAIEDACKAPYVRPSIETITALRFLVGDTKTASVDNYLVWLDMEPQAFKKRLLEAMYADRHRSFSDGQRRAFRANHHWYVSRLFQMDQIIEACEKHTEKQEEDEPQHLDLPDPPETLQQMKRRLRRAERGRKKDDVPVLS